MSKRLKKSDLVDELERSSSSKIGQHDDHDLDGEWICSSCVRLYFAALVCVSEPGSRSSTLADSITCQLINSASLARNTAESELFWPKCGTSSVYTDCIIRIFHRHLLLLLLLLLLLFFFPSLPSLLSFFFCMLYVPLRRDVPMWSVIYLGAALIP